jgi:hypothetical protein
MHAFITLHRRYRGSPPPGLHPQRFGSWLFYYGSSVLAANSHFSTVLISCLHQCFANLDFRRNP